MNPEQFYEQLLASVTRLADAAEIIARHLDPEGAKRLGKKLPDLRRPLTDYATFDWSSIGAKVVARDRSGPTEVDYNGVICKRRSGEGRKGKAIWFNVVTGGNVEDGNITYERLITFRDSTPAEPLAGQVEAVIGAERAAQPPAPQPPAPQPPAPQPSAPQPAPQPSVQQPAPMPQSAAIPPVAPATPTEPPAPAQATAQATAQSTAPAAATAEGRASEARSPEHVKAWFITQAKKYDPARSVKLSDRAEIVEALNGSTDNHAGAVIAFLCGCNDVIAMKYPCVQALRDWLKPTRMEGHVVPTNVMAIAEASAIVNAQQSQL